MDMRVASLQYKQHRDVVDNTWFWQERCKTYLLSVHISNHYVNMRSGYITFKGYGQLFRPCPNADKVAAVYPK
jgi:hypothetical protein